MNGSPKHAGAGWLGMIGVAIGLAVALAIDRLFADSLVDRPVVIAGVTALVALVWLMAIRLAYGPTPARAKATGRSEP